MNQKINSGRLTKSEIEYLLPALKANLKAAKSAIMTTEPKLREEFEQSLNTRYPLQMDGVWMKAFAALLQQYKKS